MFTPMLAPIMIIIIISTLSLTSGRPLAHAMKDVAKIVVMCVRVWRGRMAVVEA